MVTKVRNPVSHTARAANLVSRLGAANFWHFGSSRDGGQKLSVLQWCQSGTLPADPVGARLIQAAVEDKVLLQFEIQTATIKSESLVTGLGGVFIERANFPIVALYWRRNPYVMMNCKGFKTFGSCVHIILCARSCSLEHNYTKVLYTWSDFKHNNHANWSSVSYSVASDVRVEDRFLNILWMGRDVWKTF